jgi:hypothetical protein
LGYWKKAICLMVGIYGYACCEPLPGLSPLQYKPKSAGYFRQEKRAKGADHAFPDWT